MYVYKDMLTITLNHMLAVSLPSGLNSQSASLAHLISLRDDIYWQILWWRRLVHSRGYNVSAIIGCTISGQLI